MGGGGDFKQCDYYPRFWGKTVVHAAEGNLGKLCLIIQISECVTWLMFCFLVAKLHNCVFAQFVCLLTKIMFKSVGGGQANRVAHPRENHYLYQFGHNIISFERLRYPSLELHKRAISRLQHGNALNNNNNITEVVHIN